MKRLVPQIIGLLAVGLFLLSYQMKDRKNIIITNVISRALYILQYLLLGAFSGAVLDIIGMVSSLFAERKHKTIIKKHIKVIFFLINICIVLSGLVIAFANERFLDLFPVVGVLLHTNAFWLSNEKIIRKVSLAGSPFWFIYNFFSKAYGSAIGDVLTMLSIITAMIKYRNLNKENNNV